MKPNTTFTTLFLVLLTGCTATGIVNDAEPAVDYETVANPNFAAIANVNSDFEKGRMAILGMRGDYRVDFAFQETVALAPGYEKRDEKATGGYETVFVVEDDERRIILQHLLVSPGGHVIKHWRQDWIYEAKERFEFIADQSWQVVSLDPEKTQGTWTQCVYEVSDAPRYCGTGKWNHRYGVSTWTSDRTWRPLPRREYTQRSDYNAINAENRHTVTPHGWTHEQDNTKTLREGRRTSRTLVREFGFNDYRNIEGFDFSPATEYWANTARYWSHVRAAWRSRMSTSNVLRITTEVDGMPIIVGTFEQAANAPETTERQQIEAIEMLLDEWTETTIFVSQGH